MARVSIILTADGVWGGSHQFVVLVADELTRLGHEVTVVAGQNARLADTLAPKPVGLVEIPSLVRSINPRLDLRAYRRLIRLLRDTRPDVVISNSSKAGAIARLAGRRASVPVVHVVHGWAFAPGRRAVDRLIWAAIERILYPLSPLITVSEYDKRLAKRLLRVSGQNVYVVQNGVPYFPVSACNGASDGPVRFLCIGRLDEQKDHRTLLRAWAQADLGGAAQLDLVGGGRLASELTSMASDLAIDGQIRFHGEQADVSSFLESADVFVLTSLFEGLPLSVLEAMRASLPVIATRTGGTPEAVIDGKTGLLVECGDVHGVAESLRILMNSETTRRDMGANGRQLFESEFTMDQQISNFCDAVGLATGVRLAGPEVTDVGWR